MLKSNLPVPLLLLRDRRGFLFCKVPVEEDIDDDKDISPTDANEQHPHALAY